MEPLKDSPSGWPEECGLRRCDLYREGRFRAICIGNVYQGRYVVLGKLGFGAHSTVWLVHDAHTERYFAMKVLSTETTGTERDGFELEILKYLESSNADHPGHLYVSSLVDSFHSWSSIGLTVFLIFELMGETLGRFSERKILPVVRVIPSRLLKRFTKQLLLALDHAHKSGVIHTDLKLDNIMIQIPDQSVVERRWLRSPSKLATAEQAESEPLTSDPDDLLRLKFGITHDDERRNFRYDLVSKGLEGIYLESSSEEYIMKLNAVIVDWGLAERTDKHFAKIISPVLYRSPECLIGAPWDTKSDIWLLGIALIRLAEGFEPFEGSSNENQFEYGEVTEGEQTKGGFRHLRTRYNFGAHLKEIATMIEPFPKSLLERAGKKQKWFLDSIFDDSGTVWGYDFCDLPPLEDNFTAMEDGEDKEDFIRLIRKMMRVDPEDRSSAEELLQEPWLQDVVLDAGDDKKPDIPTFLLPADTDAHPEANIYYDDEDYGSEIFAPLDDNDYDSVGSAPSDFDPSVHMHGSAIHLTADHDRFAPSDDDDFDGVGSAPSDVDTSTYMRGSTVFHTANNSNESLAPSNFDTSTVIQAPTSNTSNSVDPVSPPETDPIFAIIGLSAENETQEALWCNKDICPSQCKKTITAVATDLSVKNAADATPASNEKSISSEQRVGSTIAAVDGSTDLAPGDTPSSPKKRKLSVDEGKSNTGKKKQNKKRKRGGKR